MASTHPHPHIVFVTPEYPLGAAITGGIGTSIAHWAQLLAHAGWRCSVLAVGDYPEHCEIGSVHLYGLTPPQCGWPKSWWLRKRISRLLWQLHAQSPIDIVEFPDWQGWAAGVSSPGQKWVKIHGSDHYFCKHEGRPTRLITYLWERWGLRQAQRLLAVSHYAGKLTLRHFGLSPQQGFQVLPNWVHDHWDTFTDLPTTHRIVYCGSLLRKKGLLDMPKVWNALVEKHPQAELWLVGRDAPDALSGHASTLALFTAQLSAKALQQLRVTGAVTPSEAMSLMHAAALCWFPSRAEALPMTWIEAMMLGKPIVASRMGWAEELFDVSQYQWLLDPADHMGQLDALHRLLDDGELRRTWGASFRRQYLHLYNPQTASLWVHAYAQCLS